MFHLLFGLMMLLYQIILLIASVLQNFNEINKVILVFCGINKIDFVFNQYNLV